MKLTEYIWEEKIKKQMFHPVNATATVFIFSALFFIFMKQKYTTCIYPKMVCVESDIAKEMICQQAVPICTLPTWWNNLIVILVAICVTVFIINWIRILLFNYNKHTKQQ